MPGLSSPQPPSHWQHAASGAVTALGYGALIATPQTDDYPEHLERVVGTLLSHGVDAAAGPLAPIAYPRHDIAVRNRRLG